MRRNIEKQIMDICYPLKQKGELLYDFCVNYGISEVKYVFYESYDSRVLSAENMFNEVMTSDLISKEDMKYLENVRKELNDKPIHSLYELNFDISGFTTKQAICMNHTIKNSLPPTLKIDDLLEILREAVDTIMLMPNPLVGYSKKNVIFPFFSGTVYYNSQTEEVLGKEEVRELIEDTFEESILESERFKNKLESVVDELNSKIEKRCGVDINDL